MMQFIVKQQVKHHSDGAMMEEFHVINAHVPELEELLRGGGMSEFTYDLRTLVGGSAVNTPS